MGRKIWAGASHEEVEAPSWGARWWESFRQVASRRGSAWSLAALAAMEAVFFPIPPDALLAALAAAHPEARWRFALITTVASVMGGLAGYAVGFVAFETVGKPILAATGAASAVPTVQAWFAAHTFLLLLLAAFTPIPYKAFTLTGGALAAPLLPFFLASLIGRGVRFFFVAWLSARYGERVVRLLLPRINLLLALGAVGIVLVLVWRALQW